MTRRKTTKSKAPARRAMRPTAEKAPARAKPKLKSAPAAGTARAEAAMRAAVLSLVCAGLRELRRRCVAAAKRSAGSNAMAAPTAPIEDAIDRLEADYRRLFKDS